MGNADGQDHDQLVDAQFGKQAERYVESSVHATGVDLRRIGDIARIGVYDRVLDLGCGGGHVTYAVAPHVSDVVACDLSQGMLDAVATEAAGRHLSNVRTALASSERLPFADASFDLVVSRYSVHHWRDWEAGLREARRVVRPDGCLVFVDVMAPSSPMLDTHLQAVELLRDPSHVRDRSMAEWIAALGRAAITPVWVEPFRLPLEFVPWVERMATPDVAVDAIRWLQRGSSSEVQAAFQIKDDGGFVVDAVFIECRAGEVA
ncbi:class I SAM-dependent methyltransferase [Sphingomonas corticis]|uniref:Class I SAM-dependent methyltransferase n=1 Tax=Sphingomonas corticis TaxID=2722791 RepID=A0ABX1CQP4_9SPHN|nr:class I SAM-dependent methyltransferase [Sphingomonas corticis]NJR80278.1 class I SAM-dependent methyltransferase [Sphingomonas corticis]